MSNEAINNQTNETEQKKSVETTDESQGRYYTQEELDLLIQQNADRRVNQALQKAEKKNAEKLKEAEKLANMNAQERYAYELETREKAIAEKERALAMLENKNEASKILAEKGISLALVDFVVDESADVMADRIKLLDTEFKKSVRAEVEKRLGGNNQPKSSASTGSLNAITPEAFAKMTTSERQRLARTDRDLYDSLSGRLT